MPRQPATLALALCVLGCTATKTGGSYLPEMAYTINGQAMRLPAEWNVRHDSVPKSTQMIVMAEQTEPFDCGETSGKAAGCTSLLKDNYGNTVCVTILIKAELVSAEVYERIRQHEQDHCAGRTHRIVNGKVIWD